jgi:ABC-type transporter Mla subunit MlaD
MAEYRRAEIVSGVFIVASVLVFALFAFKVKGTPIYLLEDPGVLCEADFPDVGSLDSAAPVKLSGHRIGTVTKKLPIEVAFSKADLDEEKNRREKLPEGWAEGRVRHLLRVQFKITDSTLRLGPDATAAVVQEGFIGTWYIAVDPGTWDAANPPKPVGERQDRPIRLRSRRPESLMDLVPAVKPLLSRVDSILTRIDKDLLTPLLEGKEGDLKKIVPDIAAAVADAGKGVKQLQLLLDPATPDSPVKRANKLLDDADAAVLELKKQLTTDVLPALQAAVADGKLALAAAKKTMEDASSVLDESKPRIKALLDNLRDESARLDGRLTDIQKRLGKLLDDADHLATLRQDQLADMMESFKNAAWELELAARKVRSNPAVLIFGDDEKQRLEADPRDDTGFRRTGRVKPYEKRDETPGKKE